MKGNLVLSRKLSESVVIRTPSGEVIEVTVVQVREGRVRLAFLADKSVKVNRSEVDQAASAA